MNDKYKLLLNTFRKKDYCIKEYVTNEVVPTVLIVNPNDLRYKVELILFVDFIRVKIYDELMKYDCIERRCFTDIKRAYYFIRMFLL